MDSDLPEHDGPLADQKVSAAHAAGREAPPAALDAMVLALARVATARAERSRRIKRFTGAFAAAATLALGLAVTMQVMVEPTPSASAPEAAKPYEPIAAQAVERAADALPAVAAESAGSGGSGTVTPSALDSDAEITARTRADFRATVDKPSAAEALPAAPVVVPAREAVTATAGTGVAEAHAVRATESELGTARARQAMTVAAPAAPVAPVAEQDALDAVDAAPSAKVEGYAPSGEALREIGRRLAAIDALRAAGKDTEADTALKAFCAEHSGHDRCR